MRVNANPAVSARRNHLRAHVGEEGDEPDDGDGPEDGRREERPLHHRDVQVDVVDHVQGEDGERAGRCRRGGDREGDARAVSRPSGEADQEVRERGEDADPRGHSHEHFRQVHARRRSSVLRRRHLGGLRPRRPAGSRGGAHAVEVRGARLRPRVRVRGSGALRREADDLLAEVLIRGTLHLVAVDGRGTAAPSRPGDAAVAGVAVRPAGAAAVPCSTSGRTVWTSSPPGRCTLQ